MREIRILASAVVDRIAAGEVVERPASVVKEAIENSLDAGARSIRVRIRDGGRTMIEIEDDGHGMSSTDAALAFTQHATSKIVELSDLERIETLGFRGEALASIAAVGRVEMITGTGAGPAVRVRVAEGAEPRVDRAAGPRGTRLVVRDLFHNTPARHKHLRTDATERARVASVVEEFALLRPDVSFRFLVDERETVNAPPVATLAERVHQVLGADVADAWIPVARRASTCSVRGGVTSPDHTRADRRRIHLFVNGRAVADGRLAHAVVAAYDTLLPSRRYPVAALFLDLDPADVDVNVHPRKAEVRFVEPGRVFGAVRGAVATALAQHIGPARLATSGVAEGGALRQPRRRYPERDMSLPLRDWRAVRPGGSPDGAASGAPAAGAGQQARSSPIAGTRGAIQPLAQYANTYILAADDDGLLIIDQHVAHERILFERVLDQRRERGVVVQRLLVPEPVELSVAESAVAEEHQAVFAEFGFEIEPFGDNTWAIRAVPEILGARSAADALRALMAAATGPDAREAGHGLERELAASIACHSAVRANQPLSREVMGHLVAELAECRAPTRCPHGRPVMVRIEHGGLERQLGRH